MGEGEASPPPYSSPLKGEDTSAVYNPSIIWTIIFLFSELYNKIVSKELIGLLKRLALHHKVFFVSFEEIEEEAKGKNYRDVVRRVIQHDGRLEKELIISDLNKHGINTIRVNRANIRQQVVNNYFAS